MALHLIRRALEGALRRLPVGSPTLPAAQALPVPTATATAAHSVDDAPATSPGHCSVCGGVCRACVRKIIVQAPMNKRAASEQWLVTKKAAASSPPRAAKAAQAVKVAGKPSKGAKLAPKKAAAVPASTKVPIKASRRGRDRQTGNADPAFEALRVQVQPLITVPSESPL